MTRLLRAPLMIAGAAIMLGSVVVPMPVEAQGRRAVPRPEGRRSVVVRTYYYRPLFYDPWYSFGYGYRYRYPTIVYGAGVPYSYDGYGAGTLRIKAKPREAEVFLDGYYAGTVDDFDGIFQRLYAEPGEHVVELYLPGHRTFRQEIYLQPGRGSTLELTLEPLGPGDPQPIRPDAGTLPRETRDTRETSGPGSRSGRSDRPRDAGTAAVTPVESEDAYGTLSLRVQPGEATVLIDGEPWEGPGLEERLVLEVVEGRHVLEIRKDGYRGYMTEVTIRRGETSTLNVALAPR